MYPEFGKVNPNRAYLARYIGRVLYGGANEKSSEWRHVQ
ncbi:hypothetical protein vBSenI1_18 [Salmonella phage vB_Sen_I1]|uniref:Uncharacterized protein n=1 Tax=Salmonella phage vB_Sen_I1 TaxID=2723910 RepID=A0A7L5CDL8_9CAUD|nr:hypothetical protein vBSenI1_18 [Salmonella phage vB_Sen_I1]